VYVPDPPTAEDVADPLHKPAQVTLPDTTGFPSTWVGVLTITVLVSLHPFASFTVTVYVPAHNPVMDGVVCPPGAHEYVYPGVPPPAITEAVPLHNPKQVTSVELETTDNGVGWLMVTLAVAGQPFKSVTFTE
jgi:hypothetical protein